MPGSTVRLPAGLLRFSLLATFLLACCAAGLIAPRPGESHEPVTTRVTFNKEIVRIFQRHCLACHDSSNITNIPLRTYAQARPWAKAFKEEVLERRMPPSQAVKGFGQFQHDYALTQRELDLIVSWVEGGAPKGDDKDLPPRTSDDWPLGKPDLILSAGAAWRSGTGVPPMDAQDVRATLPQTNLSATGYETRCVTLPTNLNRDVSVTAMDFRADDDVESASFGIASGRIAEAVPGCRTAGVEPLGSWIPGQPVVSSPKGTGRRLPAGARIVMEIRYRKGPQPLINRSALGLYLTEARGTVSLRTITLATALTDISAGAANHRLKTAYEVPQALAAISVRPLLFPFAKSIEVTAHRPDGTDEVLVWARDYRYDWQPDYVFARPVPLPRGTRVEVTAYLDNSDGNPHNPSQPARGLRMAMPLCELSVVKRSSLITKTDHQISLGSDNVDAPAGDSYVCPMHPEMISDQPGQCPRCSMTMRPTRAPEASEYGLKMIATPAMVKPGEKFNLNLFIAHPKSGKRIRDFNVVHDMPYHLFVVSQDLRYFAHLHPEPQADGRFTIGTTLPSAGAYLVYSDFFPKGGLPQVIYRNLITSGFAGDLFSQQARLEPDSVLSKTQDGIRFDLTLDPAELLGGKPATLKYHLTDERTGAPVKDLQPYLGAWGHTLIISEDARSYVHSHPQATIPDNADRNRIVGSADIAFDVFFPQPGIYRVWSQFQRRGKVITVSFTISVRR
ncbi:MAG TPA: heavy metal-binding domain-containing protein [Pyrinomonadaceae bacterium]|nr:heavy metal-binding domain-containing protein [Pyrinomonadaceae bacterium]